MNHKNMTLQSSKFDLQATVHYYEALRLRTIDYAIRQAYGHLDGVSEGEALAYDHRSEAKYIHLPCYDARHHTTRPTINDPGSNLCF